MNLTRILQRLCQCLWVAVSIVVLVGCKSATQPEAKYGMVQTQAVAHTPYNVTQFYVNNHWGGSAGAYGTGGGGLLCSYSLPLERVINSKSPLDIFRSD